MGVSPCQRVAQQVAVLLGSMFLLTGCSNLVVADAPRFAADDASSTFVLRDGLWITETVECPVDVSMPVTEWPACAQWNVVRGGVEGRSRVAIAEGDRDADHATGQQHRIVVSGVPLIMETSDCPQSGQAETSWKQPAPRSPARKISYCYIGIAIAGTDPSGRITRFTSWPVVCGIRTRKGQAVTDRPWEGLKLRDENCLAVSEWALRNAARRSRDTPEAMAFSSTARWVRDRPN